MTDKIIETLRSLESDLKKAERYREKWERKAASVRQKLEAYRLVVKDQGLLDTEVDSGGAEANAGTMELIRAEVREMKGEEITLHSVRERLPDGGQIPSSTISHTLRRMQREGDLRLVMKGRGPHPSRYAIVLDEEEGDQQEDEKEDQQNVVRARFSGE